MGRHAARRGARGRTGRGDTRVDDRADPADVVGPVGHAPAGDDHRHGDTARHGGGWHDPARHRARMARDRVRVPAAPGRRLAPRHAADGSRLRGRVRVAGHAVGAVRREGSEVGVALRHRAHPHAVPVRVPLRPRLVPLAGCRRA